MGLPSHSVYYGLIASEWDKNRGTKKKKIYTNSDDEIKCRIDSKQNFPQSLQEKIGCEKVNYE